MTAVGMEAGTEPGDFDTWGAGEPGGETDVVAVQPVTEGRAARRRQRARWKKNQRRAVVATAVALVSGSVAMVAMDQQPGDRARAAAAPEDPGSHFGEELTGQYSRPAARRSEEPRSTSTPAASQRAGRHGGDADSARTAPSDNRAGTVAQPHVTRAATPPRGHTSAPSVSDITDATGVTGGSNTADDPVTTPVPTPPPAADEGSGSQPPATQQPTTEPETRDPRLCLLVLCVG
ncbi:hypothetical protein ABZ354_25065 [Streptomyces sp. NPDC005925]|uniref:hypothetical protein n=1 Tax=Streptomyces sp. NPDC005925 TaxID=3157172 RepID=UPI00340D6417